jgi:hypothetical protein
VAGIGALDGIHGERADGIGEFAAGGHQAAAVLCGSRLRAAAPEARRKRGAHFPPRGLRQQMTTPLGAGKFF